MRQEISKRTGAGHGWLTLAIAMLASAVFGIHAEPARANNDFQNGFEDQLGRIVATQAVALGARVLTGAAYPVAAPVAYYPPVPVYAPVAYAPSYGPRHAGYRHHSHKQKVKVRQVVYYQGRPCHGSYDHARHKGHGGGGGHSARGHGYGRDRY